MKVIEAIASNDGTQIIGLSKNKAIMLYVESEVLMMVVTKYKADDIFNRHKKSSDFEPISVSEFNKVYQVVKNGMEL